jgi:hypothetical protein
MDSEQPAPASFGRSTHGRAHGKAPSAFVMTSRGRSEIGLSVFILRIRSVAQ